MDLRKVNEGQVVSLHGEYGVRISKDRISYSENNKTCVYCDIEHAAKPYALHVYWETLKFVEPAEGDESRASTVIARIKAALAFFGVPAEDQ